MNSKHENRQAVKISIPSVVVVDAMAGLFDVRTSQDANVGQPILHLDEKDRLLIEQLYRSALQKYKNGDYDAAEHEFRAVLQKQHDHDAACHYLGLLLHRKNQSDEGIELIVRSIQLRPDKASYFNNHGVVLAERNRIDQSQDAFQRAVQINPHYADARSNLGKMFLLQNQLDSAEHELNTALQLDPGHKDARNHFCELRFRQGNSLFVQEHFDEAEKAYRDAASIRPEKEIWKWKSLGFCPAVFPDEESIECYWKNLNEKLDYALDANISTDWRNLPVDGFVPSFNLPHLGKCCRAVKEKFASLFKRSFTFEKPSLQHTMRGRSKIRVGFVVTTGHHHGFLRVHRHLLERLDARKFEVFCLCSVSVLEACRQTVNRSNIVWVPLSDRFEHAVHAIREARCDIVYHWKVGGGTFDYFLPFANLALIQCTSYGTHGTSGVEAVDYYLTSPYIEPEDIDFAEHYTEKTYLFEHHVGYLSPTRVESPACRAEFGFSEDDLIFLCPHRQPKFQPAFDFYIKEILKRLPHAQLLMLSKPKTTADFIFQERMKQNLGKRNFERIQFLPKQPPEPLNRLFSICDIVLDSPFYAGSLTSYDAFSFGIPVITQAGEFAVQCYTSGLYRRMNLRDFNVPVNCEQYIDQAIELGGDSNYRYFVREQISSKRERIFEDETCVQDFETFFEQIVDERRTTSSPITFPAVEKPPHDDKQISDLVVFIKEKIGSGQMNIFLNPGNAGDSLINVGMLHLLERSGIPFEFVPHGRKMNEQILFYSGGGNYVPYYSACKDWLFTYHENNDCIVLPHTIDDDSIDRLSQRTRLICRERMSYEMCQRRASCDVFLHQDLAFYLDIDRLGIIPQKGNGTLHAFRQDSESLLPCSGFETIDLSKKYTYNYNKPEELCDCARDFMLAINQFENVVTDRLHVAIGASLLRKHCTLLPNSYYKNEAVFAYSLKDKTNVQWCSDPETIDWS